MTRIIFGLILLLFPSALFAAERRTPETIDLRELVEETQPPPAGLGTEHVAVALWMPKEFWLATLVQQNHVSKEVIGEFERILEGVTILVVSQADVSPLGRFDFETRERIVETMQVSYDSDGGIAQPVRIQESIGPELATLVAGFRPLFSAAMGDMGESLEVFVLENRDADGNRLVDPWQPGRLDVHLTSSSGAPLDFVFPLPLNALYAPRKCPNGMDAHVTWRFCPWSGEALPD